MRVERRGDIPLVSKERFDDFEGRGVSNRWDRPAGRNGRGLTRRDRGRGPLAQARRKSVLLHVTWKNLTVCGKGECTEVCVSLPSRLRVHVYIRVHIYTHTLVREDARVRALGEFAGRVICSRYVAWKIETVLRRVLTLFRIPRLRPNKKVQSFSSSVTLRLASVPLSLAPWRIASASPSPSPSPPREIRIPNATRWITGFIAGRPCVSLRTV